MNGLADLAGFAPGEFAFALAAVLLAGLVRGFSGFALSALVMASLTVILAPVELLPICLILEIAASALMARGGIRLADRRVVVGLISGLMVSAPFALALTTTLAQETSRMIALALILTLAATMLLGLRVAFFDRRFGPVGVGLLAGVANGLASVGGMVVAIFALASAAPAPVIRATLVTYLVFTSIVGVVYFTIFGVLTEISIIRGAILAPVACVGVALGAWLFTPRLQPFYRPFCLSLLIALAVFGLVRAGF